MEGSQQRPISRMYFLLLLSCFFCTLPVNAELPPYAVPLVDVGVRAPEGEVESGDEEDPIDYELSRMKRWSRMQRRGRPVRRRVRTRNQAI